MQLQAVPRRSGTGAEVSEDIATTTHISKRVEEIPRPGRRHPPTGVDRVCARTPLRVPGAHAGSTGAGSQSTSNSVRSDTVGGGVRNVSAPPTFRHWSAIISTSLRARRAKSKKSDHFWREGGPILHVERTTVRTGDPHLGKVMLYQLSYVRWSRHRSSGKRHPPLDGRRSTVNVRIPSSRVTSASRSSRNHGSRSAR